ncbi:MAG: HAMP domain-containing protein [Actinobacteria bacterium]|nr:HAMP domain-containing protein [Actinomycetota bacterium]MBO0815350.1 HAMP domain-containing protein [Actinomycetota bacterium]
MSRIRAWLPRRTIRLRLTLLYGGLFFATGAGLLTVTYLLADHTGGVIIALRKNGHAYISSSPRRHLAQVAGQGLAAHQRAADMYHLLVNSGIALAVMAVIALALGWLIAGHVLRPLRAITATTEQISARNLDQRLALPGPGDELKHLADTIDGLLDRLEAAFTAQRHFVANASHELRTPLTYDRTLLEITLADPHATAVTLRAACEEMLTSSAGQERLIDALLTLATSERGLDTRQPFDLAALAAPIAATRRAEAENAGLRFDGHLGPAPAVGDPRLIERLITNLIDNAIAHNTTDGRVEISTGTRAGRAFISVANTGPHVPPDQIERLLQPFQRLGAARTRHPDGHGLGLSIVAAISDAHHASLTARPNPGGGLIVTAHFPPPAATPARHNGKAEDLPAAISEGLGFPR